MNSTIVEYVEGIEVIKAFGHAGVSYEKYAKAINAFRVFVVKWLSSTYLTMKLSFALFPSTLIGTAGQSGHNQRTSDGSGRDAVHIDGNHDCAPPRDDTERRSNTGR